MIAVAMQRISSQGTFFHKRIFPVLWVVLVLGIPAGALLSSRDWHAVPPPVFLMPVLMLAVGFALYRVLIADLADEVTDAGNALIVRFGAEQERIPLDNIVNVNWTTMVNPPRATLFLRKPGRFGKRIAFSPVRKSFAIRGESALLEPLLERIDSARRGADKSP